MPKMTTKMGYKQLLGSDITLLSRDRLFGVLELKTNTGQIDLLMNKVIAERLLEDLVEFLQAGEGEDVPRFLIERQKGH